MLISKQSFIATGLDGRTAAHGIRSPAICFWFGTELGVMMKGRAVGSAQGPLSSLLKMGFWGAIGAAKSGLRFPRFTTVPACRIAARSGGIHGRSIWRRGRKAPTC